MAKKITRKNSVVYRGFNFYDSEIEIILESLKKFKNENAKPIAEYIKRTIESAEEE